MLDVMLIVLATIMLQRLSAETIENTIPVYAYGRMDELNLTRMQRDCCERCTSLGLNHWEPGRSCCFSL